MSIHRRDGIRLSSLGVPLIALCLGLLLATLRVVHGNIFPNNIEIDVSWDFEGTDRAGWANATAEEMQMDAVRAEGGELRAVITGPKPSFDSPIMLLDITRRHYLNVRMMYAGGATKASMILKYASRVSDHMQRDFSKANWESRAKAVAIAASGGDAASIAAATDESPYTSWTAPSARTAYIVLDVLDNRWVTAVKIQSSGDENSPKRVLLQRSQSSGVGPFVTAASFTMEQIATQQEFTGFEGHARYWRLFIIDTYGATNATVRDIQLEGYDEGVTVVPFELNNTGKYVHYSFPISNMLSGPLNRVRFQFHQESRNTKGGLARPVYRETLAIDYIRILRAPEIWRVRGCLNKYADNKNLINATYNVTSITERVNDQLPLRYFDQNSMELPFAATYDCPIEGGPDIRIDGYNFGPQARVFIGPNECIASSFDRPNRADGRLETLVCRLPPGRPGPAEVRVVNGLMPTISGTAALFSYRTAPPPPRPPRIRNVAAKRIDLTWDPPGVELDHLMTTGYKIMWFQPEYRSRVSNMTVGNVTMTSVRGLEPNKQYVFAIAAVAEGGVEGRSRMPTDMYGRRDLRHNAMVGEFSTYTEITATVPYDFNFKFFGANNSLNHSGVSTDNFVGPTGDYGSQGHFGITIVGSAHIQNCNVSSSCCDGYDPLLGVASCKAGTSVCYVDLGRRLSSDFVVDGVTRRQVPLNVPYDNGKPEEKVISTLADLKASRRAALPTSACGPAMRLTPSLARESGAIWYRRKMNVREGFDTRFTFRISNPSTKCTILDDVNTYCRSRGADGLALVIQNESPVALGGAGKGLGYEGIFNSLAVELDTFNNYDLMDYYENHVAIMTESWRGNITANHTRTLSTSTKIPDLTDGEHTVRVRYVPNFDNDAVFHPSFEMNGYTLLFLEGADYPYGGQGEWWPGLGMMFVYVDDLYSPVITIPINLDKTLKLDVGKAFVGITAATGESHWQVHDVLDWQFTSLYMDQDYTPPLIINGEGDHRCVNAEACLNYVDYDHYMRKNNVWGKGYDSAEAWQTGAEGFCLTC